MDAQNQPEPMMTASDVAEWLGFSTKTILAYADSGILPSRRIGNRLRFLRSEIEAKLEAGDE